MEPQVDAVLYLVERDSFAAERNIPSVLVTQDNTDALERRAIAAVLIAAAAANRIDGMPRDGASKARGKCRMGNSSTLEMLGRV